MKIAIHGILQHKENKLLSETSVEKIDYPILIQENKEKIFSIASNGNIFLRGEKIGCDKNLAKLLTILFWNNEQE